VELAEEIPQRKARAGKKESCKSWGGEKFISNIHNVCAKCFSTAFAAPPSSSESCPLHPAALSKAIFSPCAVGCAASPPGWRGGRQGPPGKDTGQVCSREGGFLPLLSVLKNAKDTVLKSKPNG